MIGAGNEKIRLSMPRIKVLPITRQQNGSRKKALKCFSPTHVEPKKPPLGE